MNNFTEYQHICYLISCAINNTVPQEKYIKNIDLDKCYDICNFQCIVPTVYFAVKNIKGITEDEELKWIESYALNLKTNLFMQKEREKIIDYLHKKNIWTMPLKGLVIEQYYPNQAMRVMSDNDILFNESYKEQLYNYLNLDGYEIEEDHRHLDCKKKPCYHFEFHKSLYTNKDFPNLERYYLNIEEKFIIQDNTVYLSKEDLYIYQISHHYRHNQITGSGMRPIIDLYVYIKNNKLNWDYIYKELDKIGIREFEEKYHSLAFKIFEKPFEINDFSKEELNLMEFSFNISTYGSMQYLLNKTLDKISNDNKPTIYYLFPSLNHMRSKGLECAKYKFLLPIYWIMYNKRRFKTYGFKILVKGFKKHK